MTDEEFILRNYRKVAVVGLSDNPERYSCSVAEFLEGKGYEIIPVNPSIGEWKGKKSYASLLEIPGEVEVVDVFRRREFVKEIVDEAIRKKAKAVWMQEGVSDEEAAGIARKAGLKVVMDKCMRKEHLRVFGR